MGNPSNRRQHWLTIVPPNNEDPGSIFVTVEDRRRKLTGHGELWAMLGGWIDRWEGRARPVDFVQFAFTLQVFVALLWNSFVETSLTRGSDPKAMRRAFIEVAEANARPGPARAHASRGANV